MSSNCSPVDMLFSHLQRYDLKYFQVGEHRHKLRVCVLQTVPKSLLRRVIPKEFCGMEIEVFRVPTIAVWCFVNDPSECNMAC